MDLGDGALDNSESSERNLGNMAQTLPVPGVVNTLLPSLC